MNIFMPKTPQPSLTQIKTRHTFIITEAPQSLWHFAEFNSNGQGMECWLGIFMSRGGRASCHFKDAFIIFKILTSSSILLINWQLLIKHEIYFPFQCFLFVCVFLFGLVCFVFFVGGRRGIWRECLLWIFRQPVLRGNLLNSPGSKMPIIVN